MSDALPLALAVSPAGELQLDLRPPKGSVAPAGLAHAFLRDFAEGPGKALLELAARHPAAPLPPSLAFFRELAALFLSRLRGLPEQGARAAVAAPGEEFPRLAAAAPPMAGGEYLDAAALEWLWSALGAALRKELVATGATVAEWFAARGTAWSVVGRVCFHLAENKHDSERPFAFLATYTTRLSNEARPQHRPLGEALRDAKEKHALLTLLVPVQKAAARSPLVRELVESAELYSPQAWTAREAHRFLRETPALEESGIVVRVPDWWKRRARVGVQVTVGGRAPQGLGLDALVDFDARLALEGEPLSAAEVRALHRAEDGLVLVRNRWVELDKQKLDEVLARFELAQGEANGGGVPLLEAMRLLAGAESESDAPVPLDGEVHDWSRISAGPWLKDALAGLRSPEGLAQSLPDGELRTKLRPYQEIGARWLGFAAGLGLGACLADDMGLGKTVQVIAFLLARRKAAKAPSLLVVPASLIGNWTAELARFAPSLRFLVAHPSAQAPGAIGPAQLAAHDLVITTYGTLVRSPIEASWDVAILDEAQAIKNPGAKQTRAVKALRARARIALTGTPVENRPGDLWSIFDFLNPGLLGSAKAFGSFVKRLDDHGYGPVRELTRPYLLRRLKTDKSIIRDLPDKTEVTAFCGLAREQAALYQRTVDELARSLRNAEGIKRRGLVLASLLRLKQICNHPSQWLRDGAFAPGSSGKFARLSALAEEIASRQEKVLVFTQFREMTEPLAQLLAGVFGREGLVLHGETRVRDRAPLVERFQSGDAPFFVLSLKAGGVGLNLTAASQVIHFDRWWNPAVEQQATDRAFRIGQKRNVLVHRFVCRGTLEEKIDAMLAGKRELASSLLDGAGGEVLLTELSDADLLRTVSIDLDRALEEG